MAPFASPLREDQSMIEMNPAVPGSGVAFAGIGASPELDTALRELTECRRQCAAAEKALVASQRALRLLQRSLSSSRASEAQARALAGRDPLTGLPNRLSFGDCAAAALTRQAEQLQGLCLLFIDLDGFKAVNDCLGHAHGDSLLKVVGARLVHAVRGEDHVGRYGGDEFVCLMPQVHGADDALAIGRKLIDVVSAPVQLGSVTVQVRASVGVAMFPHDGQTVDALVDAADRAMLSAKLYRQGVCLAGRMPSPYTELPPPAPPVPAWSVVRAIR